MIVTYEKLSTGEAINLEYHKDNYILKPGQIEYTGTIDMPQCEDLHTQAFKDTRDAQVIAKQYKLDRVTGTETVRLKYASSGEQLDMQYYDLENGTTTWKDHIEAVKKAHPKPE